MFVGRVCLALSLMLPFCGCADSKDAQQDRDPDSAPNALDRRDVLRPGRFTVDVMEMVAPRRMAELGERLQRAMSQDPGWSLEAVTKAKPGEPLPYDPRMGLSEAEYREFLALGKKLSMRKKEEAALTVVQNGDQVFVLDGGKSLPDLTGIEVDLKKNLVRTKFGVATDRSRIDASHESAIGAWEGTQWESEAISLENLSGTVFKLAIGRLRESGRCVLTYDVNRVSTFGKTAISTVLIYDLPAEK